MALTSDGGKPNVKPTTYSPPKGPTNINDRKSPGLHGANHGNAQCPSPTRSSGSPGLGGDNKGTDPS